MQAWKMGIKAIAVYRDGCKEDQPITVVDDGVPLNFDTDDFKEAAKVGGETLMEAKEKRIYDLLHPFRKPLNVDRDGKIHRFEIAGHKGYLTIGLYEDGTPGEIFLASIGKEGQSFGALADGWATLFSISLQYGVPLKFLIDKFKDTKFEPSGITPNENIRFTSSLFDYVCRYLENEFLKPEATISDKERPNELNESVLSTAPTGALCSSCGGMLQRAGTCLTCTACGSTTGCG
jgi:ribonucleoside-diphosphate reductase alpha chain